MDAYRWKILWKGEVKDEDFAVKHSNALAMAKRRREYVMRHILSEGKP